MLPPKRTSRRTTLGPVHMNRNTTPSKIPKPRNSRKSMAPRVGRENAVIPPSPSVSVVSSGSNLPPRSRRRTTIGVGRKSMAVVNQDLRPIQDKAYQTHGLKMLLKFLTEKGYEYPVSLKSLSRPSAKDFKNVVTFLLQNIDPTFGTPSDLKFEEEVSLQFKSLGYPYPLSKTALVAAGSPHTWPTLLAALIWLVEHIIVASKDEEERKAYLESIRESGGFESLMELETKTDKAFFGFLHDAYKGFLAGENYEQNTDELIDMFEQDNMVIEREIERVSEMNGAMVEKINQFEQQGEHLEPLSKKREDLATEMEQFHDLVKQMDNHKEALAEKVKERSKEVNDAKAELDEINAKIEEIQQKISEQEISVEDVQKMNSEQARLKEAREKVGALQKFQKEGLYETQRELDQLYEDLECLIREYSQEASELSRWMDLRSVSWKMTLKKGISSGMQSDLLGVDITKELQPFLDEAQTKNSILFKDAKEELQSMLDDLESSQEKYTEAVDRKKMVDSKLDKVYETTETEKEQQDAALQVRLREVESLEKKIDAVRNPAALEEQIFQSQHQYEKLESMYHQHMKNAVIRKQELQNDIHHALSVLREYFQNVENRLQELKQYAEENRPSLTVDL